MTFLHVPRRLIRFFGVPSASRLGFKPHPVPPRAEHRTDYIGKRAVAESTFFERRISGKTTDIRQMLHGDGRRIRTWRDPRRRAKQRATRRSGRCRSELRDQRRRQLIDLYEPRRRVAAERVLSARHRGPWWRPEV